MFVLAGVVLLGGVVSILSDQQMAPQALTKEAVITRIDEGWCTYEWSGEPHPATADQGDVCPDDAEVGEYAVVLVTPDGWVWTSQQSLRESTWVMAALLGVLVMSLVGLGLWLRRRVGRPDRPRAARPASTDDPDSDSVAVVVGLASLAWILLVVNTAPESWGEPGLMTLAILPAIAISSVAPLVRSGLRARRQAPYIAAYTFPDEVGARVAERHPHLDAGRVAVVLEGLRHFMLLCLVIRRHQASDPVRITSRVVDDAWCAFTEQGRAYERFCDRAFGKYLPRASVAVTTDDMLLVHRLSRRVAKRMVPGASTGPRTLWSRLTRPGWARITLAAPLPSLFAIDEVLRVERPYISTELRAEFEGRLSNRYPDRFYREAKADMINPWWA